MDSIQPRLIGISGGSGSGKTYITQMVAALLPDRPLVLSLDRYYKGLPPNEQSPSDYNFDHPDALDFSLLKKNLNELTEKGSTCPPEYCFQSHKRKASSEIVHAAPVIIVEGIHTFADEQLSCLFEKKIFISTSSDVRFIRRIRRDLATRGRTIDSIIEQYENTVRPMYLQYIEPTRQRADLIVDNDHDPDIVASRIAAYILDGTRF